MCSKCNRTVTSLTSSLRALRASIASDTLWGKSTRMRTTRDAATEKTHLDITEIPRRTWKTMIEVVLQKELVVRANGARNGIHTLYDEQGERERTDRQTDRQADKQTDRRTPTQAQTSINVRLVCIELTPGLIIHVFLFIRNRPSCLSSIRRSRLLILRCTRV